MITTSLKSRWLNTLLLGMLAACSEPKRQPPPPATVLVVPVVRERVPLLTEAVATIDGFVNADIRARVRGYVRSQDHKDGATVKRGQLLFSIEPDEYSNAVAAARASLLRAEAAKKNGAIELTRNQLLSEQGLVAVQTLDNAVATAGDADGQVLAARAAMQQAELNLSYTQVPERFYRPYPRDQRGRTGAEGRWWGDDRTAEQRGPNGARTASQRSGELRILASGPEDDGAGRGRRDQSVPAPSRIGGC
jgi:multidrug efflux pump subunit AcrA (membrane-fusion protein)